MFLSGGPHVLVWALLFTNSVSSMTLYSRAQSQEETEALKLHNDARAEALRCSPPESCKLEWDDTLKQHAQQWAQHLADLGQDITPKSHSQGTGEGENLAQWGEWWSDGTPTSTVPKLSKGVQGWLNEKKNYHGEKIGTGNFQAYGHYTQAIWKSTKKVGMGKARAKNGKWYTVARYSPQGNVNGQTPYGTQ